MRTSQFHTRVWPKTNLRIAVIYNREEVIQRGEPGELSALQATAGSAGHVLQALLSRGYNAIEVPLTGTIKDLQEKLSRYSPQDTFLYNLCDEFGGENNGLWRAIAEFEALGYRYTASTAEVSNLCTDKPRAKMAMLKAGVQTPLFEVVEDPSKPVTLNFPLIVKPALEDGSLGIHLNAVVLNEASLRERIVQVLDRYHQPALVEEFIAGREFSIPLWGNQEIEVLSISEMDYSLISNPYEHFLSYESKWDEQSMPFKEIKVIPAVLNATEMERIDHAVRTVYRAFGLRDYARIDVRYANDTVYVLEVNEVPELVPNDGFCNAVKRMGYSFEDIIERILCYALEREGLL